MFIDYIPYTVSIRQPRVVTILHSALLFFFIGEFIGLKILSILKVEGGTEIETGSCCRHIKEGLTFQYLAWVYGWYW